MGKIQRRSLEGKGVREIDEIVEEVTRIVTEALDKYTPRIKSRTLPHPEIDEEIKSKTKEVGKIKNLLANGIYFRENKRTLIRLRTELREKWKEKRDHE